MTTLNVEFAEYLTIKRALWEAVYEARAEAKRGERFGNADMHDHYENHANELSALIEKLDGQAYV